MSFAKKVRGFWISCQQELFPWVEDMLGPVEGRYKKLVLALEMICVERFLPSVPDRMPGRPLNGSSPQNQGDTECSAGINLDVSSV